MISKAVIPIAGLGTRLKPLTGAIPKAMLPLVDSRGKIRSVLHCVLAEAHAAGAQAAGLVVSPGQQRTVEAYLAAARQGGADDLPAHVEFIRQPRPRGFGDAVLRAADFVAGDGAFLLMLGDHIHVAEAAQPPCAAQVAAAFERFGGSAMVGVQDVAEAELARVGACRGEPLGQAAYLCADLIEKPDPATARQRLVTPGLPAGRFLGHCGIYVFTCDIFECLRELRPSRRKAELELTDAQLLLLSRRPRDYRLLKTAGRAYDTGTPERYAETFLRFSVV